MHGVKVAHMLLHGNYESHSKTQTGLIMISVLIDLYGKHNKVN